MNVKEILYLLNPHIIFVYILHILKQKSDTFHLSNLDLEILYLLNPILCLFIYYTY